MGSKEIFIAEIQINSNEWGYKKGQLIIVPVYTNTIHNVNVKIENKFCGSEYPSYTIKNIKKCYEFLYKPIM